MADGDPFKSPPTQRKIEGVRAISHSIKASEFDERKRGAVSRYYAFKDSDNALWEVMSSLDRLNVPYEFYGEDDTWSLIQIHGFVYSPPHRRTYEVALDYAKDFEYRRKRGEDY